MSTMMERLIKVALFTPNGKDWGLPLLFWGGPGTSKSGIIETIARLWALPCEVLSPGERGEGAFGVVPVPIEAAGETVLSYPAPDWLGRFEDTDGGGVVFGDELTTAEPRIQAALLGLIHARRIGGRALPTRCRVLCAANPVESAAGGYALAKALANRVGHIAWENPSVEIFGAWLLADDGTSDGVAEKLSAKDEEKRVMKMWPEAYALAKGRTTAFLYSHRSLMHVEPSGKDPNSGRAWPSHRTWTLATRAAAGAEVHGEDADLKLTLMSAFIGTGPTQEFIEWSQANDLPRPGDVLDGKIPWSHDAARLDRSMAVVHSCVSLACSEQCANRDARVEKLWKILTDVESSAADIVAMTIKPLSKARLTGSKTAISLLARMRPMLSAAGLL